MAANISRSFRARGRTRKLPRPRPSRFARNAAILRILTWTDSRRTASWAGGSKQRSTSSSPERVSSWRGGSMRSRSIRAGRLRTAAAAAADVSPCPRRKRRREHRALRSANDRGPVRDPDRRSMTWQFVLTAASTPKRRSRYPMKKLGFLSSASNDQAFKPLVDAFLAGLAQAGYTDGQNVNIIYKWANRRYEDLPGLAAQLVQAQVDVIATTGGAVSAWYAVQATHTIPVTFISGYD